MGDGLVRGEREVVLSSGFTGDHGTVKKMGVTGKVSRLSV